MAERVRTWTRSHMDALACVHSWSTGVMLPIPAEIAAIFPPREGHTPHITLVHVEWSSPEQTTQIMQIVAEELEGLLGEEVRLGELGYFERFEDRVAYLAGEVPAKIRAARERMAKKISDLDILVSRLGEEWTPHATLDVTEPGQDFVGSLPTGAWAIDDVQVWHGGEQRSVEAVRVDGLEQEQEQEAPPSAPAVHTESRNVFEVLRADRAELGEVQQANGWRQYPILYSRSDNIQEYPGPNGTVIREFRPEPVIRSPRSMNSGVGCPWELRHSPDLITPDTVRGVALGAVITVEADDDGIHTSGMATAWGRDLFDAIDAERDDPARARDVSVAYRVKVDPRPGTTDDGQHFDQVVVDLIWNSLASEPAGKAGTARVLTPRADATDGIWVSRADALLDIARGGATPSKPVYFDRSSWVRHDAHQPTRTTHEDAHPMNLLTRLFKALSMTEADIAKLLEIAEPEAAALLSGETELTDEQVTLLVEAIVPRGGDAKPPPEGESPPREDGGDLIAGLKALLAKAEERGDSETRRADKAEVLASTRASKLETMIPRADADKMVIARGTQLGEAMELTHRSRGATFEPEPRKDAAGELIILGLEDWQRACITGAFGDKAPGILDRIDAKSDPKIREDNLADRVVDAKTILDEGGHTTREVQDSIKRMRDKDAERRRQNPNPEGGLAARKEAQRALAAGEPQAANGA